MSWLLAAPAIAVTSYLTIELAAGLRTSRTKTDRKVEAAQSVAVLIPAHNEGSVIKRTVSDLRKKALEVRILVVADNCSDETASEARSAGAEVVERNDVTRRGKGYALAFGRETLAASPPSIVIILDADCTVSHSFIEEMTTAVAASGTPAQASNLFEPDTTVSTPVQISNFAMLVKNLFRMRGLSRLGGTVALLGTGMAFPWRVFAGLPLATGDATEDIKLTVDHISAGGSVAFAERAQVWSSAESTKDTAAQRQRWEHGFLAHSVLYGVPNLARGLRDRSRKQIALALHLLVPPLALLVVAVLALLCVTGVAALLGASASPAVALIITLAGLVLLLCAAYMAEGRPYLSAKSLASLPFYLAWKLPIYLNFLRRRQRSWDD